MNQSFREFLFEASKSPAEVADDILERCMPFVNAVGDVDYGNTLYRGTHSELKDFEVRERKDKGGISGQRDDYFADFFAKKFKVNVNNIIFVTSDLDHAKTFGNPFVVFPVGPFKYIFSKTNKPIGQIHSTEDLEAAQFVMGVADDESEDGMSDPMFLSAIERNAEVLIIAGGYYPIQLAYWQQNGQKVMENLAFR